MNQDAERKDRKRRSERDLTIPEVKDRKRRALLRDDDCEWLRVYFPDVFYEPFTYSRRMLVDEIGSALRYGSRKCVAAPRGDGKSTITKYLSLKYELERSVEFILVLAATGDKSHKILGDIKKKLRFAKSKEFREDYPLETIVARYIGSAPAKANNVTANGGRHIRVEWQQDLIVLPSYEDEELGGIMMSHGITSDAVQGCNYNDIRPSFVILDDLDSRDSLAAVDGKMAGKIETIIDHTVAGLGGPGRRLGQVMLCTIPNRNSVAYRYSDPQEKPAWSGVRIPRIKKWPENKGWWDEYVHKREEGKKTNGPNGKPIDPHGRNAYRMYAENRVAMDAGAELSNEYDYEKDVMPDGTPKHASALQKCYDYIADNGMDSFMTEHQNDPPAPDGESRLVLSSYHIQNNCLSGVEKRIVPDGTVCITTSGDPQKLGLHYVTIATNAAGASCIIDYDFHEFRTEGKKAADCELLILEGLFSWYQGQQDNPFFTSSGEEMLSDLTLLDMGWKEESWNMQPVQAFCSQVGFAKFMPSKGMNPYQRPKDSRRVVIGDNWHVAWPNGSPIVEMNSDHWKLKVHEGFLAEPGQPGSLLLFEPPKVDGRQSRTAHLSFSKHVLAETWETRSTPGFKGQRTGWWKSTKPNHYFDATYGALVARSMRGISVLPKPAVESVPAVASPQPIHVIPAADVRRRW